MRLAVLSALAVAVLASHLATAAPAADADIERTIRSQVDAFLADDFSTAFSFASPTIKGIFGTAENFGAMVRQGYPMVYRPADVQMLDQREVAGRRYQRVMVTDRAGRTHILDYKMIETPDGWQIDGVQILPGVGVGT